MRADDPEDIIRFRRWLERHGPSTGTVGTYISAMRKFIREFGGKIDLHSVCSAADVERIRRSVSIAIEHRTSSISIWRLQRALIPGLNHYVRFAIQSRSTGRPSRGSAVKGSKEACGFSISDVRRFVSRCSNRVIPTIGERTTFTARNFRSGVIVHPASPARPIYVPESHEFFVRFNKFRSFATIDYRDVSRAASYLLAILREILAEKFRMREAVDIPLEVLAASRTEREALLKSRVGQGRYRNDLLKLRKSCYVTGLTDSRFLRASHILPWKDSNNMQRLDAYNGLLLSPNYDALFNDGFISFFDHGKLMVSKWLPLAAIKAFGLKVGYVGDDLGPRTKVYLAIHRKNTFKGPARENLVSAKR